MISSYAFTVIWMYKPAFFIPYFILLLMEVLGMALLFNKSEICAPGFSLLPFFNIFTMYRLAFGHGWVAFLLLIPLVNIVVQIIFFVKLSEAFCGNIFHTIGLIIWPGLFYCILGGNSMGYDGPY